MAADSSPEPIPTSMPTAATRKRSNMVPSWSYKSATTAPAAIPMNAAMIVLRYGLGKSLQWIFGIATERPDARSVARRLARHRTSAVGAPQPVVPAGWWKRAGSTERWYACPMPTLLTPPGLEMVLQGLHDSEIRCGIRNEPPAGGITTWIDFGSRTEKATFYGTIVCDRQVWPAADRIARGCMRRRCAFPRKPLCQRAQHRKQGIATFSLQLDEGVASGRLSRSTGRGA